MLADAGAGATFVASLGDVLAVAVLALAWLTFRLDRAGSYRGRARAARALLEAVEETFFRGIGALYFSTVYDEATAAQRAVAAAGQTDQVFVLPREPVASLVAAHEYVAERLISPETSRAATFALWQIDKINALIAKQTTFNATHAPVFADATLPAERRDAVADASTRISLELHRDGIGDAQTSWYGPLKSRVEDDLKALMRRYELNAMIARNASWLVGDAVIIALFGVVLAAYIRAL